MGILVPSFCVYNIFSDFTDKQKNKNKKDPTFKIYCGCIVNKKQTFSTPCTLFLFHLKFFIFFIIINFFSFFSVFAPSYVNFKVILEKNFC